MENEDFPIKHPTRFVKGLKDHDKKLINQIVAAVEMYHIFSHHQFCIKDLILDNFCTDCEDDHGFDMGLRVENLDLSTYELVFKLINGLVEKIGSLEEKIDSYESGDLYPADEN